MIDPTSNTGGAQSLVDVVILTYNHEKYIEQAITSALAQETTFPFRILIGNDASTDRTGEIVARYAAAYPDKIIEYTQEKNIGAQRNAISTFFKSTAKYIAHCEGDDYWTDPLKLQKQIDFLEANPDYSICFHRIMINQNGKLLDDWLTKTVPETTTQKDLLELNNYLHTPSVIMRNTMGLLPDWFEESKPGDYILWLMQTNKGEKIKFMDASMAVYRVHGTGIWSTQTDEQSKQRFAQTVLIAMRRLGIDHAPKIHDCALILADHVYEHGFRNIARSEYFSLIRWSIRLARFSFRQIAYMYTASIRRRLPGLKPEPLQH